MATSCADVSVMVQGFRASDVGVGDLGSSVRKE